MFQFISFMASLLHFDKGVFQVRRKIRYRIRESLNEFSSGVKA